MPWAIAAAAVLVGVLASEAAYAADGTELLSSVSVKDAADLLTEAGAQVEKVDFGADDFTITAGLGPERHIWFEGMNCNGSDQARTCKEFKISARWELKTAARATEAAKKLSYSYTSVFADGRNLELWRMDFTYGGITREHLRLTLREMLRLRDDAESIVWPASKRPGQ